jgi:hypothetical protein
MNHANEDYPMNYKKPDALRILTDLLDYLTSVPDNFHLGTNYRYRSRIQKPIALGVLIPDSNYNKIINGLSIEVILSKEEYYRYVPSYFLANKELLLYCQKVIELNPALEAYKKLNRLRSNILITAELFNNLLRAKGGG